VSDAPPDQRSEQLTTLARRITGGDPKSPFSVPGLAVVIRRHDGSVYRAAAGTDAAGVPVRDDTLFPIASASKLAAGIAALGLVERGLLALDAPLAEYLPRAAAARDGVTIRRLLSHTSGLPIDVGPRVAYRHGLAWPEIAAACLETPLDAPPGTRVQYSNVAYGLLGIVAEQVSGTDYRTLVRSTVFAPLGIEAYMAELPPRHQAVIGDVDSVHAGTDLAPFNSDFSRRVLLPWSQVTTTADGLLALLDVYAGARPDVLRPETVADARADQTEGLAGGYGTEDPFIGFNRSRSIAWAHCPWGLAVELRGAKRPHWTPPAASPGSFGQIGSSGCLAWCDPERGASWAFLAPRTTDSGWLLRHGAAIGNLALQAAAG
jgi:beta-lactamase class C